MALQFSALPQQVASTDQPCASVLAWPQVVSALTVSLPLTYQRCSPLFTYNHQLVPRRVLTKPSEGLENQGYDNANSDLVVYVHDVFVSTTGTRSALGRGAEGSGGVLGRGQMMIVEAGCVPLDKKTSF